MDSYKVILTEANIESFWRESTGNFVAWDLIAPDPAETALLKLGTELEFIYKSKVIATALMVSLNRFSKNITVYWNRSTFLDQRQCSKCKEKNILLGSYLAIGTRRTIKLCQKCRASIDK